MTRIRRRALRHALEDIAALRHEGPDAQFVDDLERRLMSGGPATSSGDAVVLPLRRRIPRAIVIGVVAASLTGAAAAAAAIVATGNDDRPAIDTSTTSAATTTTVPPTTTAPATTVVRATIPPVPQTTLVAKEPTTTQVPKPTTTTEAVVVATTVPPPPEPSPTTEVSLPITISSLKCAPDGVTLVRCTWSAGSGGAPRYRLLRSKLDGTEGRVLTADTKATTFDDSTALSGITYVYLVQEVDANGVTLGRSNPSTAGLPPI